MGLAGIGWRHAHYGQLLQALPTLPFLEVHSENFFGQGGAALAVLEQARGHYPISLHGVGLGLGSACGIDPWHVQQLVALAERIDPVRVSDHACFARAVLPGDSVAGGVVHGADLLPLPFSHAALDALCANVQQVQDALKRPLAVENLSASLVEINRTGLSILLVEQDVLTAFELSRHGFVLETGRVTLAGPTAELAENQLVRQAYIGI